MPQDLFNSAVLAVTLGKFVGDGNPGQAQDIIDRAMRSYLDFYTQDNFLPEVEDSATRTLMWLRETYPNDQKMILVALTALSDAAMKFDPNGDRKRRRFFNGLRFTSATQPVPERQGRYFQDLTLYYLNIQLGKIGG